MGSLADANLTNANLSAATLNYTELYQATLRDANLSHSTLEGADLSKANLSYAYFSINGEPAGMDLTNSYLFAADLSDTSRWEEVAWTGAKYSLDAVDNSGIPIPDTIFPAGMDQAWRDNAGMVAVPEPATALLIGLGLVGLGVIRGRKIQ